MVNLSRYFPLPFTCLHATYQAGVVDDHGNAAPDWATPTSVPCVWWSQTSNREYGDESVSNDQAAVDLNLVVDSGLIVDQRDRFTVDGRAFEVVGLPKDFDHGPFGFSTGRQVIELRWVG